jgi:hypothetical protein
LLVDENYQRLMRLMARCEAKEVVEEESDEEAAFDDSPEGERLHRYQNLWSRMLERTLDAFDRLHERTEEEPSAEASAPTADRHEESTSAEQQVILTNQTHREIRKLSPSRSCPNPAPLQKPPAADDCSTWPAIWHRWSSRSPRCSELERPGQARPTRK